MPIRNRAALASHGLTDLRAAVLEVAEAGLGALDPGRAARHTLQVEDSSLYVAGRTYPLDRIRRILLLGAGKASLRVAQAVEAVLGDQIEGGLVVVPRGQSGELRRTRLIHSDHPLPSESSLEAARQFLALAHNLGPDDLIIATITGGSSALVSHPPAGVSFEEKRDLHRLLLASGADITGINAVRKHVSAIKGGRLAARLAQARILNLTVSDVSGDPADYITDLTVPDTSTVAAAIDVLQSYDLCERVAPSIRRHLLESPEATSPSLAGQDIETIMLVTGATGSAAMKTRSRQLGFEPIDLRDTLVGESAGAASMLAGIVAGGRYGDQALHRPCMLFGCGGETTVSLGDGDFGAGGPNQELALRLALALQNQEFAAVFLDTDGSDGGTIYAGGIVDGATAARASQAGIDLADAVRSHRSQPALAALGDLVDTGPTYTNVNDLFVLALRLSPPRGSQQPQSPAPAPR